MGWVTYGSSRVILVGLGNLRFLQVNIPLKCVYLSYNTICVFNEKLDTLELLVTDLRLPCNESPAAKEMDGKEDF